MYDLIIIGTGVAGLSAAIYAGRYKLKTLVVGKELGGETTLAGTIENYPGFKSIEGFDLVDKMKSQAVALGAEMADGEVTSISRDEHCFLVEAADKQYAGHAVIIASGMKRRHLGLAGESELNGRGVHYCVTCDGPLYSGKAIAVVGGGDAAVKGAVLAAQYAKKVYLIVREDSLVAEPINVDRLNSLKNKIEVLYNTEVKSFSGQEKLEAIELSAPHDGQNKLVLDGVFIEIGAEPDVSFASTLGIKLDARGFVQTDNMMRTNVDGVFAAGDIVNHYGTFKQDVTAAAMGAVAATSAYEDRQIHADICEVHRRPVAKPAEA